MCDEVALRGRILRRSGPKGSISSSICRLGIDAHGPGRSVVRALDMDRLADYARTVYLMGRRRGPTPCTSYGRKTFLERRPFYLEHCRPAQHCNCPRRQRARCYQILEGRRRILSRGLALASAAGVAGSNTVCSGAAIGTSPMTEHIYRDPHVIAAMASRTPLDRVSPATGHRPMRRSFCCSGTQGVVHHRGTRPSVVRTERSGLSWGEPRP